MRAKGGSPYLPTLVKISKGRRHLPPSPWAEQDKLPFYLGQSSLCIWDSHLCVRIVPLEEPYFIWDSHLCVRIVPLEEPYHPLCFTDVKITCSSNTHDVAAL